MYRNRVTAFQTAKTMPL